MEANPAVIRALRVKHGLTVGDLAARVGISRQSLTYIEAGRVQPRPNNLKRLAGALGVTVEVLSDVALDDNVTRRRIVARLHDAGLAVNEIASLLQLKNTQIMRDLGQVEAVGS